MRTTVSVRTDHIHLLSNFVGRLQAGYIFAPTAYELTELGNLAGAMNAALAPPADPLDRIKAAPSQWAKWLDLKDVEAQALIDRGYVTREQKDLLNNWWRDNGVKGQRWADGTYHYAVYVNGVEHMLVDTGGADAATEAASGKQIPGPML